MKIVRSSQQLSKSGHLINYQDKMKGFLPYTLILIGHCCTVSQAAATFCVQATSEIQPSLPTLMLHNGSSCSTIKLTELVTSTSAKIRSDTTILFLSGKHLMPMNSTLYVANVERLVLSGQTNSSEPTEIDCRGENSGIRLENIVELTMTGLKISNCGTHMFYQHTMRHRIASLFLANITNLNANQLDVSNGIGYGLYGVNILGHSSIASSHFRNNTQGGNSLIEYHDLSEQPKCMRVHHLLVTNSSFRLGQSILRLYPNPSDIGSGLSLQLRQINFSLNITIMRVYASDNIALRGPNFQVDSYSNAVNTITVQDCNTCNGTVLFAGGSGFHYTHFHDSHPMLVACKDAVLPSRSTILLNNNKLTDSHGRNDPSLLSEFTSNAVTATYFFRNTSAPLHTFSIRNCDIVNNVGADAAGFYGTVNKLGQESVIIEIANTTFRNNTSTAFQLNYLSVIWLAGVRNARIANVVVYNNIGTGILSVESKMYFDGVNTIQNNTAYNGGGISFHGDSFVYLKPYTRLALISNKAINVGGGIYIDKLADPTIVQDCFFQFYDFDDLQYLTQFPEFQFEANTAGLAGNDLYGGSLERCYTNWNGEAGYKLFPTLANKYRNASMPDVSAKPIRVCLCNESNEPNCTDFLHSVSAYPGSSFSVSAIGVGQMLFYSPAGAPSAVYASLLLNTNSSQGVLPEELKNQGTGRYCSMLTYKLNSRNTHEVIALSVEIINEVKQRSQKIISKAQHWFQDLNEILDIFMEIPAIYINVTLLPCPLGFELTADGSCNCASMFIKHDIECSVDTQSMHRVSPMWMGMKLEYSDSTNDSTPLFIVHRNCPYDYCNTDNIEVNVNETDLQCAMNRTGILCGACKDGLSSILGGSQCKACSNLYILLLIPFALAGVVLILLLLGANMTVTVGTINGLLFYANIIQENQTSFFLGSNDTNLLTVFIAWLNLDFGINTCFFDGMDTYAKVWLQFVFPVYIWLLTTVIIVSSHYFMSIAKLCGKNIVQVLATLFLLSHTKLQRAIITGLSFTAVQQSNNQTEYVWLPDPTLTYGQGKHIYLLLASLLFFACLFLPYTFVILFGPCLLAKSNYRLFSCIQRLKPLFDAYFGPYKDKHRYWTGLLLFARMVLVVISAANVFGDPSVNLLAASTVSYVLSILLWQSGGVYRMWLLNYLESFFFLNIGLLSTVTLYIHLSGGYQFIASYLSTGTTFVLFLAILLYHILVHTPVNVLKRSCTLRLKTKFSFLQQLLASPGQESNQNATCNQFDVLELRSTIDSDSESECCEQFSSDTDSDERRREVSSIYADFIQ